MTRYRPMIIIADSKITAKDAQARALREQRRRLAKSITFEAEIDGWTRKDGQLWMPNLLVTIDASKYAIKTTELLVSKVTLILNDQDGLKTRVSLAPREGFLVPVESDRKTGKAATVTAVLMRWLKIIIADTRRKRRHGKSK